MVLGKNSRQWSVETDNVNESGFEHSSHNLLNLIHVMVENVEGYEDDKQNATLIISNRNFKEATIPQLCIAGFDNEGIITDSECIHDITIDGLSVLNGLMPETMYQLFGSKAGATRRTGLVQIVVRNRNEAIPLTWSSNSINEYILPWMRKSFSHLREDNDKSHLELEVVNATTKPCTSDHSKKETTYKTNGCKHQIKLQVSVDQSGQNLTKRSMVFGVHIGDFYYTEYKPGHHDEKIDIKEETEVFPLLPVYCDSGYFSLHPDGTKTIICEFEFSNSNDVDQRLYSINVHAINAYDGEWIADYSSGKKRR